MKILQFLNCFFSKKPTAASIAKERLQIIVSHESNRHTGDSDDIMKQLQMELIAVISKYIHVDQELIKVQLERNGDHSVLELNVTLPEGSTLAESVAAPA
jgi:cell division topological specificity factor